MNENNPNSHAVDGFNTRGDLRISPISSVEKLSRPSSSQYERSSYDDDNETKR